MARMVQEGLQRVKDIHQLNPQLSGAALVAETKRRLRLKARSAIVRGADAPTSISDAAAIPGSDVGLVRWCLF